MNRAVIKDYCHYCSQVLLRMKNIMNYQNEPYLLIFSAHSCSTMPSEVIYSALKVELPLSLLLHTPTDLMPMKFAINCALLFYFLICYSKFFSLPHTFFDKTLLGYHNWWWRLWDVLAIMWAKGTLKAGSASLPNCKKRKLRKSQDPEIRQKWAFPCCVGGPESAQQGKQYSGEQTWPHSASEYVSW